MGAGSTGLLFQDKCDAAQGRDKMLLDQITGPPCSLCAVGKHLDDPCRDPEQPAQDQPRQNATGQGYQSHDSHDATLAPGELGIGKKVPRLVEKEPKPHNQEPELYPRGQPTQDLSPASQRVIARRFERSRIHEAITFQAAMNFPEYAILIIAQLTPGLQTAQSMKPLRGPRAPFHAQARSNFGGGRTRRRERTPWPEIPLRKRLQTPDALTCAILPPRTNDGAAVRRSVRGSRAGRGQNRSQNSLARERVGRL